jgi:hypothetical protein
LCLVVLVLGLSIVLGGCAKDEEASWQFDCRTKGEHCSNSGKCHFSKSERKCIANSTEECQASTNCKKAGECTLGQGKCILGSKEDCIKAGRCESAGECHFNETRSYRVAPSTELACIAKTESDCLQSVGCKKEGRCFLFKAEKGRFAGMGYCKAGSPASCEQSEDCKTDKRCFFTGSDPREALQIINSGREGAVSMWHQDNIRTMFTADSKSPNPFAKNKCVAEKTYTAWKEDKAEDKKRSQEIVDAYDLEERARAQASDDSDDDDKGFGEMVLDAYNKRTGGNFYKKIGYDK